MKSTIKYLTIISVILLYTVLCYSQVEWEQKLDGWVDDVYYPYLFLGGSYYTRISLADIDNDGDLDMFYGGGDCGSLVYFENIGNAQEPKFELRYEEFPGLRNMDYGSYGGTVDVDFADLDLDCDLDAAYSTRLDVGGTIMWNDGSPGEPNFVHRSPYGPLAGQSNVTLVDIDNDGDYDYFSGQGYSQHQMYYAENRGTPEEPYFEHQGDTYHYQDLYFGIPFNFDMGDIDEDGDYDLIVCKHGGNITYYENIGTSEEANFVLVTDDFLPQRDTTDWMETPELADIDNDGDLDLFLAGGYAYLYFFENLGANSIPQFVQRYDTTFFYVQHYFGGALLGNSVDIDGDGDDDIGLGRDLLINESIGDEIRFTKYERMLPFVLGCFVDMDADGDYDYIAPGSYSIIAYFENIGGSSWPEWGDGCSLFPADGRLRLPFTVAAGDIDNDGDNDVLVGHENSTWIDYYRNDGTSQVWDFHYIDRLELPEWEFRGIFDILLDDIDNDNDLDLLIGDTRYGNSNPIRLLFYRNDGTPEEPDWFYITDDFQNVVSQHRNGSISPSLADIDKDGDKDLVMTNQLGLQLFLNPMIQIDIEEFTRKQTSSDRLVKIYPNPSNQSVTFQFELSYNSSMILNIYNILGQKIDSVALPNGHRGENKLIWNAGDNPSGVYFYKATINNLNYHGKFILVK